jgi:hypothetical protein
MWDNITVNNRFNIFQNSKCVGVYTGYIVTEREGKMNGGQYYIQ